MRSQRVAQRCGYMLEATLRNYELTSEGKPGDRLIFVRLRPEEQ
jgi:RimJ/RimL family protein N-acetyltransferase